MSSRGTLDVYVSIRFCLVLFFLVFKVSQLCLSFVSFEADSPLPLVINIFTDRGSVAVNDFRMSKG